MLTHIHEQTHIVIVSIALSRVCMWEWGIASANPYELCTKGIKKEHRENHQSLSGKRRAMLKGPGCKVVLDSVPLASFGSNLI